MIFSSLGQLWDDCFVPACQFGAAGAGTEAMGCESRGVPMQARLRLLAKRGASETLGMSTGWGTAGGGITSCQLSHPSKKSKYTLRLICMCTLKISGLVLHETCHRCSSLAVVQVVKSMAFPSFSIVAA